MVQYSLTFYALRTIAASLAKRRVLAASVDTTPHHGATTSSAVGSFPLESTRFVDRLDRYGGVRARTGTAASAGRAAPSLAAFSTVSKKQLRLGGAGNFIVYVKQIAS